MGNSINSAPNSAPNSSPGQGRIEGRKISPPYKGAFSASRLSPDSETRNQIAKQRDRAIAAERIPQGLTVLLDGLTGTTRETVRRMAILALADQSRAETGEGHVIGTLCRAVADLSPAHRPGRRAAAEAVFGKRASE